eukprot:scaffold291780_cov67-Attheya_sp.AAC.1
MVLPVTTNRNQQDTMQVKSPEALTILQLIGNIDMAGVLLPPQLLQSLVSLYCSISIHSNSIHNEMKNPENNHPNDDDDNDQVFVEDELGLSLQDKYDDDKDKSLRTIMEGINEFVQETLPSSESESKSESSSLLYAEASPWARSKVRYPRMTLDAVRLMRKNTTNTNTTTGSTTTSTSTTTTDMIMDCTVM